MSPWLGRRWYDCVFWSSFVGFGLGHSLRVVGRRNMPETGPVLVIANHQSYLDPVLVGLASRRYLGFLARESLFRNRYFKVLIESLDAIPLDHKGLPLTIEALERGRCVLVFPEGKRTFDGEMSPFKPGISLLIRKAKCPIVPVGIAGAYHALPRLGGIHFSPLLQPPNDASIALSIGKPIDPSEIAGLNRDAGLHYLYQKVEAEYLKAKRIKRQKRSC